MTLARHLSMRTIETITQAVPELVEVKAPGRHVARLIATAHNPEAGALRIWQGGDKISRMVYIGLNAELPMRDGSGRMMGLDSHMIFAFTPKHSTVPHFTLDAIAAGPILAYHLDLLPRVELASHLGYMDYVYQGLDEVRKQALSNAGFSEAPLSPRQYALMSPWMMANRATPEAFEKIPVAAYLDRFLSLLGSGVAASLSADLTVESLAQRDRAHREALFNKDVDPVWHQIEALIGADVGAELREILKQQDAD